MPSFIHSLRYRPEIDGLRAVAVVAVVFFHAGILFTGGFVGVDVFFVISGYLITSLIVRDLDQGKFTLVGFWERRARRILPALILVALATLMAGGALLLPHDYLLLGKSAISQALFAANVYFCRNVGYFATGTNQLPMLQTWSLAVEEQFYLIVPFILLVLFHFTLLRRRSILVPILLIGAVVSFSASVYAVATQPTKAFFLLPSRAWELLLGAILAICPPAFCLTNKQKIREFTSLLGITAIGIPCFVYTNLTPFPGVAALLPCFGAALIIWSNDSNAICDVPPTYLGRLLAARLVVFVGTISYSVYLWHWPLFAFSRYWELNPLSLGYRSAMVIISFMLGALSWKYIENPFRQRQICKTRKSVFIFAGTGLAILLLFGSAVMLSSGAPQRLPGKTAAYAAGENETPSVDNVTTDMIVQSSIPKFGVLHSNGVVDVLLWGDSHAKHLLPALEAVCNERKLTGQIISFTSTTPLVGWPQHSQHGLNEQSEKWCDAVVDYVNRTKIQNVIIAAMWENPEKYEPHKFAEALERTISALRASGARVYVVMQVPSHKASVPKVLVYSSLAHHPTDEWQSSWPEHLEKHITMYDIKNHSSEFGPALVDPAPYFRPQLGDRLKIEENGRSLYTDAHHLSIYGSKLVMIPLFEHLLNPRDDTASVQ